MIWVIIGLLPVAALYAWWVWDFVKSFRAALFSGAAVAFIIIHFAVLVTAFIMSFLYGGQQLGWWVYG